MDHIQIKELEVFANHGVLKQENELGQKFVVSVDLTVDTSKAAESEMRFRRIYRRIGKWRFRSRYQCKRSGGNAS